MWDYIIYFAAMIGVAFAIALIGRWIFNAVFFRLAMIMAPKKIPDWFKHTPLEKNIGQSPQLADIPVWEDREEVRKWQQDPVYDLPDRLIWFQHAIYNHLQRENEWELKDNAARYFQWRKYFAENLFK